MKLLSLINCMFLLLLFGCTHVEATEYDQAAYVNGYNTGYEQGFEVGYQRGYDACQFFVEDVSGVKFDSDGRWWSAESETFSIEDCIDRSISAAANHAKFAYVYGTGFEHNIYWMNVHNSCAYWLEEYLEAVKK